MNEVTQFLMSHGGLVLFVVVFAEQAGLPLPSAPWLLAAGALSANGDLNPMLAIGLAALACVVADAIWFYVGRRGRDRVLRLFCRPSLAPDSCVGRTKGLFARHALRGLIAAKFLPGLGTVLPALAGALGVGASRFLLIDGLGSLWYAAFYIATGFLFHSQLERAVTALNQIGLSVLLLAVVLVSAYIGFKYLRRRASLMGRTRQDTTPSLPTSHPMEQREDGRWYLQVPLTHGHHLYQFVVDGEPTLDPHAAGLKRNARDEVASVIAVS